MELNLSEEQAMMRDTVQRFVTQHYTLDGLRRVEAEEHGWSSGNWRTFAEAGWLALPFPEDAGGLGGSLEDLAVLMVEFGHGHVLEPYVSTAVVCGHILAGANSVSLIEEVMAGRLVMALAHAETARPADLAAVGETVALEETGGGFVLSGSKHVVIDAPGADRIIVSASHGAQRTPVLVMVDPASRGVSATPYRLVDGACAADFAFDGVEVAKENVLATGSEAQRLLAEAIELGTLAYLAQAVGSIERSLKLTGDYVGVREQFGRPIGKFQALQHILATMFVEAQEARSALYHAIAHWEVSPQQRSRALSSAKIVVSGAGRFVCRQGIQLHGGYGMTEEFAIGHHFRRQIVLEKQFGDLDHHLAAFAGQA